MPASQAWQNCEIIEYPMRGSAILNLQVGTLRTAEPADTFLRVRFEGRFLHALLLLFIAVGFVKKGDIGIPGVYFTGMRHPLGDMVAVTFGEGTFLAANI